MKQTSYIGYSRGSAQGQGFAVKERVSGELLDGVFYTAPNVDIEHAAQLAEKAFRPYRDLMKARRAEFLRHIAEELEARRGAIVPRAMAETALPEARINGELGRTCGQLRMFATIVEHGTWADVRIDPAQPDRKPLPAPDIRSMLRPLGPVAVFGASNFPLAFSAAGGDTASALAAGCPVIVKAHPAHPGTSALAAEAIVEAAKSLGLPEGVFSLLFDEGFDVGTALVMHPSIKAVGFTGSRRGGLALWRRANERPEPIPVYAEMGSVNPSVVLPDKLQDPAFADGLHGSATMGVGQFCTNPGLVITVGQAGSFLSRFSEKMAATPACPMLTDRIAVAYLHGLDRLGGFPGVKTLVKGTEGGQPAVFAISAADFLQANEVQDEVFGPSTLIVTCSSREEAIEVVGRLDGQLTGSIHGTPEELACAEPIVEALEGRVGRLIVNQFPTGVEVISSMVHGGPFPATTDSRATSVGGRAILRWVRPICYQNFPANLLPVELRG